MRLYVSNDHNEKLLEKCLKDIREANINEADIEIIHLDKDMLETERRALAYSKFTEDCVCLFPYRAILMRKGMWVFNFKWEELRCLQ